MPLTNPGLYNSYLASGAPSELNIDHALRNRLDSRMIRTDADDDSMRASLDEVVELFEQAKSSVFKLMASVSFVHFSQAIAGIDNNAGLGSKVHPQPELRRCPART